MGWGFKRRKGMARGNEKKYGNKHTEVDGKVFDSLFEAKVYTEIKEMGYEIIPHPPKIELLASKKIKYADGTETTMRGVVYNPDLLLKHEGKDYYIDVKSFATMTVDAILKFKMCYVLKDINVYIITKETWAGKETVEKILNGMYISHWTKKSLEAQNKKST